jgi:kynurenine formamidase
MRTALLLVIPLLAACQVAPPPAEAPPPGFPEGRLVDLTHAYDSSTVYWPTAAGFALTVDAEGMTEGGYYYTANSFSSAEHGGTHLDAPIHFAEGRHTADQIPLDRLVGEGALIDVSAQSADDRDYLVTTADIEAWEAEHGRTVDDLIVLLRTGFGRFWPDRARYMGTDERGAEAVAKLHFPGLDPEAARWLVENRSIKAIGLDTPSIDYGQSTLYESHRALFERDVPAFENLTALERLPPRGAFVIALPMKIGGGSGAPLRAIAMLP